jgi:anti-anti-sigma regulatory factor
VNWDVKDLPAEAATVDALARLQLAARRAGGQIRLCDAPAELRELIVFMGLRDVLPVEERAARRRR